MDQVSSLRAVHHTPGSKGRHSPQAGPPDAGGRDQVSVSTAEVCSHQHHLQHTISLWCAATACISGLNMAGPCSGPRLTAHQSVSEGQRENNSSAAWEIQRSLFYFPSLGADTEQYWQCRSMATHKANHVLRLQL